MLDELLYGTVPAIKVIRGILNQKSPTVLLMRLLNIISSIWHLQDANSPIVNGKGNIYSTNFDTWNWYIRERNISSVSPRCACTPGLPSTVFVLTSVGTVHLSLIRLANHLSLFYFPWHSFSVSPVSLLPEPAYEHC
jgi:hypothetical protein